MAIKIKNVSTSLVSLFFPDIRFNRELPPGREIPVSDEDYQEMTFDSGFMALVNGHYIRVSGVEEEQQVSIIENIVEASEIKKMLETNDVTAFAKFIPNATDAEKDSAVTLAVDLKVTNSGIVALIKKYCGVDIINAIAAKHDAEEK